MKKKIIVEPSESMSKSKNVIILKIIECHGADAVHYLFYLIVLQKKIFSGQSKGW